MRTISYEVIGCMCITPCPHKEGDNLMVGSKGCANCPYYFGNDPDNETIECNHPTKEKE